MTAFLGNLFVKIFGVHSGIATVIIAMFPVVELKGAIPVGMSADFWGENALSNMSAFLFALLGSCLVVPIIALIFTPIVNWLKKTKVFKKLGNFIDAKVKKQSNNIDKKTTNGEPKSDRKKTFLKCLGVFLFVAIPLPFTGVWTGTCVGVALGLKYYQTLISVILGNIIAGIIIVTICSIFPAFTTILFYIVLACVLLVLIVAIIKVAISKENNQSDDTADSIDNQSDVE